MNDLPPLPELAIPSPFGGLYNAYQMREYARAAVEAEREACAQECDALASVEGIAQRCAAAIRAREAASCFGLNVVADPTLPSDVAVLRDPTSGKELGRITNIKWSKYGRS